MNVILKPTSLAKLPNALKIKKISWMASVFMEAILFFMYQFYEERLPSRTSSVIIAFIEILTIFKLIWRQVERKENGFWSQNMSSSSCRREGPCLWDCLLVTAVFLPATRKAVILRQLFTKESVTPMWSVPLWPTGCTPSWLFNKTPNLMSHFKIRYSYVLIPIVVELEGRGRVVHGASGLQSVWDIVGMNPLCCCGGVHLHVHPLHNSAAILCLQLLS